MNKCCIVLIKAPPPSLQNVSTTKIALSSKEIDAECKSTAEPNWTGQQMPELEPTGMRMGWSQSSNCLHGEMTLCRAAKLHWHSKTGRNNMWLCKHFTLVTAALLETTSAIRTSYSGIIFRNVMHWSEKSSKEATFVFTASNWSCYNQSKDLIVGVAW